MQWVFGFLFTHEPIIVLHLIMEQGDSEGPPAQTLPIIVCIKAKPNALVLLSCTPNHTQFTTQKHMRIAGISVTRNCSACDFDGKAGSTLAPHANIRRAGVALVSWAFGEKGAPHNHPAGEVRFVIHWHMNQSTPESETVTCIPTAAEYLPDVASPLLPPNATLQELNSYEYRRQRWQVTS